LNELIKYILENYNYIMFLTWEHMLIVLISLFFAIIIGVPTGILITRYEILAKKAINTANIFMTIPSIALFGIMLPILSPFDLGLVKVPAVIALVLYSQLPIIRNTYVAIKNVNAAIVDAARGIGFSRWRRLIEIEVPFAVPVIIAGIRTASIMAIGITTIAAYIGAGGLGVLIDQGINRYYIEMVITGAIMVSILAIFVDTFMAIVERLTTPKGLILERKLNK